MPDSQRGNFSLLNQTYTTEAPTQTCTWHLPPFEWVKLITLFIGVFGNVLTVAAIATNKKLHTITFAIICAIAVADCLYCAAGVLWSTLMFAYLDFSNYRTYAKCISDFMYDLMNTEVSVVFSASYIASALSISLLSVVRFIIISLPLKANSLLRKRYIVVILVLIWLVSFGVGIFKIHSRYDSSLVDIFLSYLLPLLTITIFHGIKIFALKRSEFQKTNVKRMERLVVVIVLFFLIFNMPWQIFRLLAQYKIYTPGYLVQSTVGYLLQFNNCVNPLLYAFLSRRIRQSICVLFCPCRYQHTVAQS